MPIERVAMVKVLSKGGLGGVGVDLMRERVLLRGCAGMLLGVLGKKGKERKCESRKVGFEGFLMEGD